MEDKKISAFLDGLASKEGEEVGGAATNLTGAIGIAAIQMAVAFSKNNKNLDEAQLKQLEDAEKKLTDLRERFMQLIDEDTEGFQVLMDALHLPKETDEEKATRREAIQNGFVAAGRPPLHSIQTANEAIQLASSIEDLIKDNIVSDIAVGVNLLRAMMISGQLHVQENSSYIKDEAVAEKMVEEMKEAVENGVSQADVLKQKINMRLDFVDFS